MRQGTKEVGRGERKVELEREEERIADKEERV